MQESTYARHIHYFLFGELEYMYNKQFKTQKKNGFIWEKTITTNYGNATRFTNKHYWDIVHTHVVHTKLHTNRTLCVCVCNMFAFKTLLFITPNNCGTNMQID
jgi:hypothetical protein